MPESVWRGVSSAIGRWYRWPPCGPQPGRRRQDGAVRPRLRPPVLVVGLLLLAACGSSGGAAGAPAGSSPTVSTAPVDPALAADRHIAVAGLIRTSDLPG